MKNIYPTLIRVAQQLNITEEELLQKLHFIFPSSRPEEQNFQLNTNEGLREYKVACKGIGNIINPLGNFMEYAFHVNDSWTEYSVLVKAETFNELRMPEFRMREYFLTRFDSHCETQMLFGDKTCDCMEQLNIAMKMIADHGEGAIIHIKNHEGRGKGIVSKLDQLSICEALGINTVEASLLRAELIEGIDTRKLTATEAIDTRDFFGCVAILKYFQVPPNIKLILQTNNPFKKKALDDNGYLCEYLHIHTEPNEENRKHLEAKKTDLNHKL